MPPCPHLIARIGSNCPKCGVFWSDVSKTSDPKPQDTRPGSHKSALNVKPSSNVISSDQTRQHVPTREEMEQEAEALQWARISLERKQMQRSFAEFAKKAWYKIPHLADTRLEWNWHHDALCFHLQSMIEDWAAAKKNSKHIQKVKNLMVNIAPGTTKSLLTMVLFPSWVWTKYPRWTVRCVSSNPRSVLESSDYARQLTTSDWYVDLFIPKTGVEKWAIEKGLEPWAVRDDKNAVSDWGNTLGGYRRSTGISAPITGEHTDWILCFSAGTQVETEFGPVDIEKIGAMNPLPRVWSYNVKTKKKELKQVTKWAHTGKKKTVTIRTSTGDVLSCTDDHPIWTQERGYVEAASLVPELQSTHPTLESGYASQTSRMQECLPCVRDLFEELYPGCSRARQTSSTRSEVRPVLFDEVPTHHCVGTSTRSYMSLLPASIQPWIDESVQRVLFEVMLRGASESNVGTQVYTETMWSLSDAHANHVSQEKVLHLSVQERSTFQGHAGEGELELFGQANEVLRGRSMGEPRALDQGTGWHAMYRVREDETGKGVYRSPYRRECPEQSIDQPDHLVRFLPLDSSQIGECTVESIDFDFTGGRREAVDVYDITVAGNHNFFANGILVHNCDDPHDAEQVNSEEMRHTVIVKWDDAIFNRVNDRRTACRVLVMQRLRHDDLSGHIIDRDRLGKIKIWCLLIIASEFEADNSFETPFGWKDPRHDQSFYNSCEGLLDPIRFPRSGLHEELTRLTPRGYAAQHQQRPDSDTSTSFKIGWWSWYTLVDAKVPSSWERPTGAKIDPAFVLERNMFDQSYDLDWVCVTVDASGGSIEEGASAVGLLIVGGKNEKRFILDDLTPGPRGFNDQVEDVKNAVARAVRLTGKRSIRVLVEKKAYGGAVLEQMEKQVKKGDFGQVDGRNIAVHFEAYDIKTTMGSKEQRALGLEPDMAAGVVYVLEGAPWLVPLLAEFKRFPSTPNDRVDALVQVVERYRKRIGWADAFRKAGR